MVQNNGKLRSKIWNKYYYIMNNTTQPDSNTSETEIYNELTILYKLQYGEKQ